MEDRLQDVAGVISDVGILPVERNAVSSEVPVPEAQRAGASRECELLVERAIPDRLRPGDVARQCGKGPAVHLVRTDNRIVIMAVNHPVSEVTGLESFVHDYPGIALGGVSAWGSMRRPLLRWQPWL